MKHPVPRVLALAIIALAMALLASCATPPPAVPFEPAPVATDSFGTRFTIVGITEDQHLIGA